MTAEELKKQKEEEDKKKADAEKKAEAEAAEGDESGEDDEDGDDDGKEAGAGEGAEGGEVQKSAADEVSVIEGDELLNFMGETCKSIAVEAYKAGAEDVLKSLTSKFISKGIEDAFTTNDAVQKRLRAIVGGRVRAVFGEEVGELKKSISAATDAVNGLSLADGVKKGVEAANDEAARTTAAPSRAVSSTILEKGLTGQASAPKNEDAAALLEQGMELVNHGIAIPGMADARMELSTDRKVSPETLATVKKGLADYESGKH